jgi:hypothetical protein
VCKINLHTKVHMPGSNDPLVIAVCPQRPWFDTRLGHVRFVVDKVALGHVFSEYFSFPLNSYSFNCSIFINHRVIDAV